MVLGLGGNLGDAARRVPRGLRRLCRVLGTSGSPRSIVRRRGTSTTSRDFLNARRVRRHPASSPGSCWPRRRPSRRPTAGTGRRERRKGPRTLDIDILLYGDAVLRRCRASIVPHPRPAGAGLRPRAPRWSSTRTSSDPRRTGSTLRLTRGRLPGQGIYLARGAGDYNPPAAPTPMATNPSEPA
ncbi:MAG: 2-amino-4-hydroxy-6-hydroxymethyldihydropteridine diphosphokinase [Bacillus subtilis]|nr:2-amino-4-hydroxy-6-hydroxymethyldihydropteridine diphosphokinase [Bacillus subtilis]